MSSSSLEDLKITHDEFDRITEAMKNEEFRKLFVEYCEEISDPENRKLYEQEIKQLESQRGVECKFVHPKPGYVIKTTDGKQKVFINVASNNLVEEPTCEPLCKKDGTKGMSWSLPIIQAPGRNDMDTKKQWCIVYDVLFHPKTLELAEKNKEFRKMVNSTAIDAVCNAYKVDLDKTNLRFPKMTYKGMPKPTVIRKQTSDETNLEDLGPLIDIMPPKPNEKDVKIVHKIEEIQTLPLYTKPKYNLKYRKKLEFHEFIDQQDAKINCSVPTAIEIEVFLPLLISATSVTLDVSKNMVNIWCEKPAKYKLELKLSYDVDDKEGTAKFNKERRVLVVILPVIQPKITVNDIEKAKAKPLIQNIESNHDYSINYLGINEVSETSEEVSKKLIDRQNIQSDFFDQYYTDEANPDFYISHIENKRAVFVINVQNVVPDSLHQNHDDTKYLLKFEVLGDGFFPISKGMIFKFPSNKILNADFTVDRSIHITFDFVEEINVNDVILYGSPGGQMNQLLYKEKKINTIDDNEKPCQEIEITDPTFIDFESTGISSIFKK